MGSWRIKLGRWEEAAERNENIWEEREDIRGKPFTHSKPKYSRWTEVTAQQTVGRLENKPSPTSFTLPPNTITATFFSLFRRKDILSAVFPVSLLEKHQAVGKAVMEMLQDWGVNPAEQVMFLLGSPVQAMQTPRSPDRGVEILSMWCSCLVIFPGPWSNKDLGSHIALSWPQNSKKKKR